MRITHAVFVHQKSGERSGEVKGIGVVLHAIKMYPACGLMLKKKLLPLMNKLVVILNHLHPCYTFMTTTKSN